MVCTDSVFVGFWVVERSVIGFIGAILTAEIIIILADIETKSESSSDLESVFVV